MVILEFKGGGEGCSSTSNTSWLILFLSYLSFQQYKYDENGNYTVRLGWKWASLWSTR